MNGKSKAKWHLKPYISTNYTEWHVRNILSLFSSCLTSQWNSQVHKRKYVCVRTINHWEFFTIKWWFFRNFPSAFLFCLASLNYLNQSVAFFSCIVFYSSWRPVPLPTLCFSSVYSEWEKHLNFLNKTTMAYLNRLCVSMRDCDKN